MGLGQPKDLRFRVEGLNPKPPCSQGQSPRAGDKVPDLDHFWGFRSRSAGLLSRTSEQVTIMEIGSKQGFHYGNAVCTTYYNILECRR